MVKHPALQPKWSKGLATCLSRTREPLEGGVPLGALEADRDGLSTEQAAVGMGINMVE